jgi:hypothetical protein
MFFHGLLIVFYFSPFRFREIKEAGALRHIGTTYAYFVNAAGGGLDVDLLLIFYGSNLPPR